MPFHGHRKRDPAPVHEKESAGKDDSSITVKGLCAAVPVARTTFYSYFNNTDDVRREIEGMVREQIAGPGAVRETLKHWSAGADPGR